MKTFKAWWNSSATAVDDHAIRVAEAAWNFAYDLQEHRISVLKDEVMELEEQLKESQQKHLDSIRALRRANEQITSIAKDNGKLRYALILSHIKNRKKSVLLSTSPQ